MLWDFFREAFFGTITISFNKVEQTPSLALTPEQQIYAYQQGPKFHAFAYVLVEENNVQRLKQVNFLVDKPYRLEEPRSNELRSMFEQLYKAGLVPVSIVTDVPGYGLRTYQSRDYLPDIAHAHGFARA